MLVFLKAQGAAIIGSVIDFLVFTMMVQLTGNTPVRVSLATAEGAFCGGLVNFLIVRKWVFNEGLKGTHVQAGRYILVWAGSILLNSSGMFLIRYFTRVDEYIARVLVSIIVGVTYNYALQKRFVFK